MSENERWLHDLHEAVMAEMDKSYDLIYVDYRDKLTDTQVNALVQRDWDSLYDELGEWESDARWESVRYHMKDLAEGIISRLEQEHDVDLSWLYDEYEHTGTWDEAREQMEERDTSDWLRQLASNTGGVLLRIPLRDSLGQPADEDHNIYVNGANDLPEPDFFLATHGIAPTPENVEAYRSICAEVGYGGNFLLPFLLAYVDVSDLYAIPYDCGWVEFTDPHLLLENCYAGSGFDAQIHGTVRVHIDDLRTDEGAPGYSWDSVCGLYKPAYAAEIRPVLNEESAA